ncbi:peptidase M43 [filamentous cyanobacterium CCP5]|nr:peptidase M43 [filamentous cyanobacterium CCP5]
MSLLNRFYRCCLISRLYSRLGLPLLFCVALGWALGWPAVLLHAGGLTGEQTLAATPGQIAATPLLGRDQKFQGLTHSLLKGAPESEDRSNESPSEGADGQGLKPFEAVVADLQKLEGLFTLYRNADHSQVYLAIEPQQLNQNFLFVATLASGIGEAGLYRGWPINDGLIQFRLAPGNKLYWVVPNVYLRGAQAQRLTEQSFSDSVLYALDIVSRHPETGTLLVDLKGLLLSRDPADLQGQFSWILGGYTLSQDASHLGQIQAFAENIEVESILGFSGSDPLVDLFGAAPQSLPDPRGFSLGVRYSLSALPDNPRFAPRLADERIGYFLSAYRPPVSSRGDPFERYIHRWHLEKRDPDAALSEPVAPIVFWIENTVPAAYRPALREGALMWNVAFERAGFRHAIEVRQMPDQASWDPADVRYNVIRWSDSFRAWAVGLGPSRVNPLTGEILDADVILDANVVRLLRGQFDTFVAPSDRAQIYYQLCGHSFQPLYEQWLGGTFDRQSWRQRSPVTLAHDRQDTCTGFTGAQQLAFGAMALGDRDRLGAAESLDIYIHQYLRALTAHEVGHVLGLRHNFLGSTLLSPEELNQPDIVRDRGLLSSVMDYFPPNLAPPGEAQGDYFPTRLGPYDLWAIEYGYKPLPGLLPQLRYPELRRIADRGQSPELAYATDEDIYDFLDPLADAWDLSSDPLGYAQSQFDTARSLWSNLDWYFVRPGEGYGQLRSRVDLLFSYYLRQALTATNYIGGQRFVRRDPWASRGQPPFEPVSVEKQRQALSLLATYVFAPDAFQFSPDLINSLAPDRWWHWGQQPSIYPLDYPIYDRISFLQSLVLSDLLYSERLLRVRDGELKSRDTAPLSLGELFEQVEQMVWSEVLSDQPANQIGSLRRGLQRQHLMILSNLVLRGYDGLTNAQDFGEFIAAASTVGAPEDARVLARYQLRQLGEAVDQRLRRGRLDLTTQAHLEATRDRISKVLAAPIQGY